MSEILKPCPFCGEPAKLCETGRGFWWVGCAGVDCYAWYNLTTRSFNTKQEAIDAWNTRANDDDGGYDPLGDDDYDW